MQVSARLSDVETTGRLLAEASGALLSLDEVSQVRLLVSEYARTHDFDDCRIVLPEGQVIAAASAATSPSHRFRRRGPIAPSGRSPCRRSPAP